jgi:hypothetical protein
MYKVTMESLFLKPLIRCSFSGVIGIVVDNISFICHTKERIVWQTVCNLCNVCNGAKRNVDLCCGRSPDSDDFQGVDNKSTIRKDHADDMDVCVAIMLHMEFEDYRACPVGLVVGFSCPFPKSFGLWDTNKSRKKLAAHGPDIA